MNEPETWRWIWLAATAGFTIGEMSAPGTFFLAPFAVGGLVAFALTALGVSVNVSFLVFLIISLAAFLALRPLARRLDETKRTRGIGANRLIGERAVVTAAIPGGASALGAVRVEREEWRAQSVDGSGIASGTQVRVIEMSGTRVVVWPADQPLPGEADDPEFGGDSTISGGNHSGLHDFPPTAPPTNG